MPARELNTASRLACPQGSDPHRTISTPVDRSRPGYTTIRQGKGRVQMLLLASEHNLLEERAHE